MTNQTTQDDVARLREIGKTWSKSNPRQVVKDGELLARAADAMHRLASVEAERDRLRKENDEIIDGVKHAISELLEHSDDSDEFARGLRNHLMGTITDNRGEAYQTELDAAIKTIDQLQQRNGHLQEAAEVWERNSEDACQLWELLRQVDQEAGNSAAPDRRHSLTPMLRDSIEKVLREKPKPEDRITAIREERDQLRQAIRDAGFGVMQAGGKLSIHDVSEKAKADEEETAQVIAENIDLQIEVNRLKEACSKQNDEVCQILGKVLGSPWYKDDQKNFPGATEENGVCVGDHVAESLAEVAAREISRLREAVRVMRLGLEVVADTNECKYRAAYIAKKLEQADAILAGKEPL